MEIRQGIDIVKVSRIQKIIESHSDVFLARIFSKQERAYCHPKKMKYEHYAARFAAKEAFIKATKIKKGFPLELKQIEVRKQPSGKPYIKLTPGIRKKLNLPSKTKIVLSMAHEREYAIATVILTLPKSKSS